MRWERKQAIWILAGLAAVIALGVLIWKMDGQRPEGDKLMFQQKAATSTSNMEADCRAKIADQKEYLSQETLSNTYSFDKYPANEVAVDRLAALDASSSRSAAKFRTKISEAMTKAGANFARHYSIVSVGMTGWGDNYWIIDRSTGKAYEFPYRATYLDFRKDSNLIVMDPKARIQSALDELDEPLNACAYMGGPLRLADLRPFYFVWEDKTLKTLGPTDLQPAANTFWHDYFN